MVTKRCCSFCVGGERGGVDYFTSQIRSLRQKHERSLERFTSGRSRNKLEDLAADVDDVTPGRKVLSPMFSN